MEGRLPQIPESSLEGDNADVAEKDSDISNTLFWLYIRDVESFAYRLQVFEGELFFRILDRIGQACEDCEDEEAYSVLRNCCSAYGAMSALGCLATYRSQCVINGRVNGTRCKAWLPLSSELRILKHARIILLSTLDLESPFHTSPQPELTLSNIAHRTKPNLPRAQNGQLSVPTMTLL
ncbi:uncharacterized protein BDR25DRAFT_358250 [Lindgomyces ingoldianus]|uniref:Uncharacterized protein n=1 Tax=Lindgomyces ingoldianus TaxID=673940 RepID=A0ACB6QLY7_9PLEO|nr:uncharacterized protein BDR25DRAFT_358250 [Lindgomyces ingoldianus]KAF2467994.1 hypothetical protein BDR25DRAFT_358250 [Lindgomyces ingoldianus]